MMKVILKTCRNGQRKSLLDWQMKCINLTDKHFEVLDFLREKHTAGEVLTIRKVGNSGITNIKEMYQLFPGGPLKYSSKIAGIPKPSSCV